MNRETARQGILEDRGKDAAPAAGAAKASERTRGEDPNMDTLVGYLLAGGVITAVALVGAGLVWHWR